MKTGWKTIVLTWIGQSVRKVLTKCHCFSPITYFYVIHIDTVPKIVLDRHNWHV